MVCAKLHLICGNCASNDKFKWRIVKDGIHYKDNTFDDSPCIICENCHTIHFLDHMMEKYTK